MIEYQKLQRTKEKYSSCTGDVRVREESSYHSKTSCGTKDISDCSCRARNSHMHCSMEIGDHIQQIWDIHDVHRNCQNCKEEKGGGEKF